MHQVEKFQKGDLDIFWNELSYFINNIKMSLVVDEPTKTEVGVAHFHISFCGFGVA